MKSELVKNAAISTLVGATLVTGVITLAPGWGDESPPPAPGPAARAAAAVGAGAPASPADLTALIGDREMWLRTHPRDEESWAVLGSAYVEQGTRLADAAYYRRAESALRRSLELFPGEQGNVDALVGLAALANARGDYAAARTSAESARKQRPQRWTAYPALIDAYNGLGDYAAAGKAMDKLQELHEDAQTMGRAAQILRDKGWREDAAAMAYNAAATADAPAEKAAALYRLGELAWERGEPVEATGHYDAALRFAPDHHPSLAARGRALAALGRTDEAFRDYQAVLTQVALPEYALEAGELYASMGLDGDATTQYERLRAPAGGGGSVGPGQGSGQVVLGLFEADHGDPEAAVRQLKGEWDKKHRSMSVADALGWALYRAGRPKEALPYAKRATDQGLRSALFAYHRGEIERSLAQYGPARRHLEEALRTNPYFSPLLARVARETLAALGEPEGG
ncbi:tetratricopeptide repeat protein, partial [Streptomyces lunaelactis]|uniref:tetratricopeptide repeat protein n=1 Tax=Streptomyces lunaelactis TaxID=1535768 RepID=UPI001584C481